MGRTLKGIIIKYLEPKDGTWRKIVIILRKEFIENESDNVGK